MNSASGRSAVTLMTLHRLFRSIVSEGLSVDLTKVSECCKKNR